MGNKLKILIVITNLLITNLLKSQNWVAVDSGLSCYVKKLTVDTINNKLLAIGCFTSAGGSVNVPNATAQFDGIKWDTIPLYNDYNYIFGSFINYQNKLVCSVNDAILTSDGINVDTIASHTNGGILSFYATNNDLFALGVFDSIMGIRTGGIARWDGTSWSALDTSIHWVSGFFFNCAAMYHGDLYIGGNFIDHSGTLIRLARWDGTHLYPVGGGIIGGMEDVLCMEVYNNRLYIGGMFNMSNGNPGNAIASWDGSNWDNVGGGMTTINCQVRDLQVFNNELYACGHFNYAGGRPILGIAKWNDSEWCGLGFGANNDGVNAMEVYNNKLYFGGYFKTVLGDTMNYITQWNGGNYTDTCGNLQIGINENDYQQSFTISPNPFTSSTTISFSEDQQNTTVKITDLLGKEIKTLHVSGSQLIIEKENMQAGIYFIQAFTQKGILNKKIVVQ